MGEARAGLKLLLLQIRDNPQVRREEHASFAAYCGLAPAQIDILNVFDTPSFAPEVVQGYDALLVGGASEASVLEPERFEFLRPSIDLTLRCIERDVPVFASCFGFQLAVVALGGEIRRDTHDFELGTVSIRLDPAAQDDPLFRDTPDGFAAVSVHRERALQLPERCHLLAQTDKCMHAFRVRDSRFWAFQFHPEVDQPTIVERLTIYKAHYTRDDAHLAQVLAAAAETPEANALPGKFVERILLGGESPR